MLVAIVVFVVFKAIYQRFQWRNKLRVLIKILESKSQNLRLINNFLLVTECEKRIFLV